MKHYNLTISGHVQGVGFRYATQRKALQLSLKGFVKNLSGGNVSIEVEGKEEHLVLFIRWCHTGPSYARVFNVDVSEDEIKEFTSFTIKH